MAQINAQSGFVLLCSLERHLAAFYFYMAAKLVVEIHLECSTDIAKQMWTQVVTLCLHETYFS